MDANEPTPKERVLRVTAALAVPLDELEFTFVRSSGPGGQNVNKVNSKAVLRWAAARSTALPEAVRARLLVRVGARLTNEGDLVITSQRYRDQAKNIDDCLEKLRAMILAVASPPKKRRPTRRTRNSVERRLQAKQVRSEHKARRRKPADD